MKKTALLLLIGVLSCCGWKEASLPPEALGLWFSEATGEWLLKLDTAHIYWQNKIEPIQRVVRSGNQFMIETTSRELEITFEGQQVEVKGQTLVKTRRSGKVQNVDIPTSPTVSYQPGIAVVQGFVTTDEAVDFSAPIKIAVADFILGKEEQHLAGLDSAGTFLMEVPLLGTQDVWFRPWEGSGLRKLLLSPGDTLTLDIQKRSEWGNVHFAGASASVNYDIFYMDSLASVLLPTPRQQQSAYGLEPLDYVDFRRQLRSDEMGFLERYCQNNACTPLFREWFVQHNEVTYFKDLLRYSWKSHNYGLGSPQRLTGDLRDAYHEQFLDSINQGSTAYQLSSDYTDVLNGLSNRLLNWGRRDTKDFEFLLGLEVLSSEDRQFLGDLVEAGQTRWDLSDEQKKVWWSIEDKYDARLRKHRQETVLKMIVDDYTQAKNSHTSDLVIASEIYRNVIEVEDYETFDFAQELVQEKMEHPAYRQHLLAQFDLAQAQEQDISKLSLRAEKFDGDGKDLLRHIMKEHKGKTIVLDFWGTWCSPCIKDFERSKEWKAELEGVQWVYLCVSSQERNWKNALVKYEPQGDHYFLTSAQTSQLLKRFDVDSYPTYLRIDPDGKVHRDLKFPIAKSMFESI